MIPTSEELLLEIMQLLRDGKPHDIREVTNEMSAKFNLTQEELQEITPIGKRPKFDVRVRWAVSQLRNAKLLENLKLGVFRITPRGSELLKTNPTKIDNKLLKQFPEYKKFLGIRDEDEDHRIAQEGLEDSYEKLKKTWQREILSKIKKCSDDRFQNIMSELLQAIGYGETKGLEYVIQNNEAKRLKAIIKQDELGLGKIYVQINNTEKSVTAPDIINFLNELDKNKLLRGIYITTSVIPVDVINYAKENSKFDLVLINGERLADLLFRYNLGVYVSNTLEIKKIEEEYFKDE